MSIETAGEIAARTHLVNIVHHSIDHLALERLEDDRAVTRDKLCLTAPRQDHALPNIQNGDHRDDVAKLSRTSTLDVRVELGLQEL